MRRLRDKATRSARPADSRVAVEKSAVVPYKDNMFFTESESASRGER